MKNSVNWVLTGIGAVIMSVFAIYLAGCATYVPIKSVRMPTINGMDTVKNLGIRDFENKSGTSVGAQLANYLTDIAKSRIPATGKFNIVAPNDPNADGVFFGEIRNVTAKDSSRQNSYTDKNGNTITYTTYTREVSVEFVYGVNNVRTNMPFGSVPKRGSNSSSSRDDSSGLTDVATLARSIVDSQIKSLVTDLVPVIVSTNRELMKETSKDKAVKQLMKMAEALVKNGNLEEALRQYDQIAGDFGSVAAKTNAGILRDAIASDVAANAKMAQLDSERTGLADKAVKNAIDALNSKLSAGAKITIMKTNSTERNMLDYVVDKMTATVVHDGKLTVIDRSNQALIDAEQQFQLSGNVSDNSIVMVGRQLGVQFIVLCWISGQSSGRQLNLRVLNVETSQITDQSSFEI